MDSSIDCAAEYSRLEPPKVVHSPREPVVLLVQPNEDNREMYTEFLERHHFTVVAFSNSDGVVAAAAEADFIVTDLRLPGGIDGVELIRRLRGDDRTKRGTVIVLTASAVAHDRLAAETAGCDQFLAMPCSPQELLDELRHMLLRQMRGKPAHVHDSIAPAASTPRRKRIK
jgi:CheY-like chemotaxis protein